MQLFLIRHPRPLLRESLCYGQLDVAAEDPLPIAERLRTLLPADIPVVASPLRRARGLAEALHQQPTFDRRLLEIDFGDWEGVAWDDIDRQSLDAWAADPLHFVAPGGESAAVLQTRALDCVRSLDGDRVALVTHAGVIRAVLGHWLRMPIDEWIRLPLAFGSVTLLEIDVDHAQRSPLDEQLPRAGILHYCNL